MKRLNRIVLVHGAWHGANCWQLVAPLLRAMDYKVSTPDLPGLGADKTPPKDVTLQSYIDRVAEAVTAAGEPVLLVGHSMGGSIVCGVAEAVSEHIGKLVILSALTPRDGETMGGMREYMVASPDSWMNTAMSQSKVEGAADVDLMRAGAIFYNTCAPELAKQAVATLRPQAVGPFATPFRLTSERFGKVPKAYIVCTQDNAVHPAAQYFYVRMPGTKRYEMNTDHSPFYCDPNGLVAIIDQEAQL
jgi:pimeloyl-ACP methyl ester carboxylesterase